MFTSYSISDKFVCSTSALAVTVGIFGGGFPQAFEKKKLNN